MDDIDRKLLISLEKDARVSLKNLAKELNVKTSTIYHRLHKLKESNILDQFTIIINPKALGLEVFAFINLKLKKLIIGDLDSMFLESFCKFLSQNYEQIAFAAVGNDSMIHLITIFRDEKELEKFNTELNNNPYVDDIKIIRFKEVIKGRKIFSLPKNLPIDEKEGEYFDNEEVDEHLTEDDDGQVREFKFTF
ncbi:MAG: Lrp/AsnC family transcriptional regulator [Promethearchaeota archaeon]